MIKNKDFIICAGFLEEYNGNAEEIVVPEGVKKVGTWAFDENHRKNVKRIILPETLEEIIPASFVGFIALQEIRIPKSVKKIGELAFYNCRKLAHVEIENRAVKAEQNAFYGTLWQKNMLQSSGMFIVGNCLLDSSRALNELEIPPYIKRICKEAFTQSKIKSIVIPEGVEVIEKGAFRDSAIEHISLPESLKIIDNEAFFHCVHLKEITIPNSVTHVDGSAFEWSPNCVLTVTNLNCNIWFGAYRELKEDNDTFFKKIFVKELRAPKGSLAIRNAQVCEVPYTEF